MEEISKLIESTPNIFYKVIARCNIDDRICNIQCKVEPHFKDEDEVLDIFQAIVDICSREIAETNIKYACIDLEYPKYEQHASNNMDLRFDLAQRIELRLRDFRSSDTSRQYSILSIKKTYFDLRINKYNVYVSEIVL